MEHIYWKKLGHLFYKVKVSFEMEAKKPNDRDVAVKSAQQFEALFNEIDSQVKEIEDLNRTDLKASQKGCPRETERLKNECGDLKGKYVRSSEEIGQKLSF